MESDKQEVRRLLDVLRTLSRMLGISNREIERRLGLHPSFLTRLYGEQVEAKLEVVLGIARAIGLTYAEFFDFLYPERPDPETASPAAQRIRGMLEGLHPLRASGSAPALRHREGRPGTGDAVVDSEDFKKAVREVLQEIFEKRKVQNGG